MDALHGDDAKPLVHSSIRVLLSTEDIDGYSFPLWACKPLNLPRPDGDMDRKDPIAPHIYKLYVGMLEMGKTLLPMKGAELTDQLENLRSNFHEKLPGNELVGRYQECAHNAIGKLHQCVCGGSAGIGGVGAVLATGSFAAVLIM